jgi:hypothetical protein
MKLDFVNVPNKYVHHPLVGCINDICFDKFEVVAKLKSASICDACLQKIKDSFEDIEVALQLKKILNLENNPILLIGIGYSDDILDRRTKHDDHTFLYPTFSKQQIPVIMHK